MTEVWGKVPIDLLSQSGLSLRDIKVYIAIASFQGRNGSCHPSVEQIASRASVGSRDVYRAIKWLEKRCLEVTRQTGRRNQYHIHSVTPDISATPGPAVTPDSIDTPDKSVTRDSLLHPTPGSAVTPPLPTVVTPILKEQEKNIEKEVRSSVDPLVAAFKEAFVSRYDGQVPSWNWAIQMKHLKGLAKRCRSEAEPEAFAVQILEAFWRLVQTGDKFWRSQPFSPMTLNSEGIFTRVVKSMTVDKGLDIDAIVDEALRRSKR